MGQEIEYLEFKFALGSITLIVGFIGASIALFQWVERTGVQYLFGDYSRYILGFGGFAAMIFGAMLINDAWVLRNVAKGKYGLLLNYTPHRTSSIYGDIEQSARTRIPKYKKRIIRNIPKRSGLKKKRRKPTRRETS
ncbi:hypothetical protein IBX38_06005 [Candidatus Bathyarchaeota archaeon]|nr:hypothetical protein [Candidatus Bathyarchaeota archaeon]